MGENPNAFGRFIRDFRERHRLLQSQVARRLGISSAALCDLENGRRSPSPKRVIAIAARLAVSELQLLELAFSDQLVRLKRPYRVRVEQHTGEGDA